MHTAIKHSLRTVSICGSSLYLSTLSIFVSYLNLKSQHEISVDAIEKGCVEMIENERGQRQTKHEKKQKKDATRHT